MATYRPWSAPEGGQACKMARGDNVSPRSPIRRQALLAAYIPRYAARTCSSSLSSRPVPVRVTLPVSST